MESTADKGALYVVATPIGNIKDITYRAIEVLHAVDCIAAEDTRHSAKLLSHYQINTPCIALHDHNEAGKAPVLIGRILNGESIAIISDAGTPLISDPGYILVNQAHISGIQVHPVPGASASLAALCASGLPIDRFVFEGFTSAKSGERRKRLAELSAETRTIIFYEAPHRIEQMTGDLIAEFGADRRVVFAREITKLHETIRSMTLGELATWIKADSNQSRGEIVLLVKGADKHLPEQDSEMERVLRVLLQSLPLKQAASLAAQITGVKKNTLYALAIKLKEQL